jgi:DNA polymerase-3 subunit delta'
MAKDYLLRVYGHAWLQQMLQKAILSENTSHAYLFAGPDQVGKTTLARAFAQALTCESPVAGEGLGACGQCRACRLAAEGGHPDHRFVEASNGQIKIEQIRNLIHEASLSPVEGRTKVFIIRGFDRANPNAANAILKTLEEPSETTRILLTSSQSVGLLPTITSRCQVLHLRPLPVQDVTAVLQAELNLAAERAELLANLSGGRIGWAIQMGSQPERWQVHEQRLEQIQELVQRDVVERLAYAEKLATTSDVEATLRVWLFWWRDVLLVQQGCDDLVANLNRMDAIRELAQATSPGDVRRFLAALMTTAGYLRRNVSVRLALEALLLKVPCPA